MLRNFNFDRCFTAARWVAVAAATFLFLGTAAPGLAAPEMDDQSIGDAVDDELLMDPGVVAAKIDVSTSDGIVTLTGRVDNILAQERAARVATAVKGVRSVINRIEVMPSATRTDQSIQQDVQAALVSDPATDSYEVATSVDDGVVALTGTVDSYQESQLVKTVVKGVRGVRGIVDQLVVQYETTRPDIEIAHDIRQALRWNVHVDDHLIEVNVDDGQVTLGGTVGSAAEKRLAETNAWVAGVQSVDASELTVEYWARDEELRGDKYVIKSDRELQSAIHDALLYDPRVMSFRVDVDVDGSVIALRGTVDNLKAKRAAAQNARNTVGVKSVQNRLKVRLEQPRSDVEIADDIRSALMRDPYVERFDITATVQNGTTRLYGTVDSFFEKNRADDLASRTAGVVDVENFLSVDFDTPYIYNPYIDDGYVDQDEMIDYERRSPYRTDAQIAAAIESELWWSPFVSADQITVTVEDGVATLTGAVGSWSERRTATENAYEGGATLVDNDLTVTYE